MKLTLAEFQKWQKWSEIIQRDIENHVVYARQVFRGLAEVVNANADHIEKHDGDVFLVFVRQCYVSHIAMSIRRHVKVNSDSISLKRLLLQIRDCAIQFTYDFYLQQFPIDANYVDWQPMTFKPFTDDGNTVSASKVQKDIDTLDALTACVEDLADKMIAHLDKGRFTTPVTIGDLDACVDSFDMLVCKYLKLTQASGFQTLEPTILSDWKEIFTVPLDARSSDRNY